MLQQKSSATIVQAGTVHTVSRTQRPTPHLTARLSVQPREASVQFALHVTNESKKGVELTFPSGQTYDFVVMDSVGREVWRWGSGKMFTQALRNRPLGGGETLDIQETWQNAALPPGRYVARALLASENFPVVQETEFTVGGTTVALR